MESKGGLHGDGGLGLRTHGHNRQYRFRVLCSGKIRATTRISLSSRVFCRAREFTMVHVLPVLMVLALVDRAQVNC